MRRASVLLPKVAQFRNNLVRYPSAMGAGMNIVLFDPGAGEVTAVWYVRVENIVYSFDRDDCTEIHVDEFPYE